MAEPMGSDFQELTQRLHAAKLALQAAQSPAAEAPPPTALMSEKSTFALHPTEVGGTEFARAEQAQGSPEIEKRTRKVITEALQNAVMLEFATIPLYLTALWSILDQAHPITKSIRAVTHEEMLHLSLLCNLLVGLGEEPKLTGAMVPRFPSTMPGGLHPELTLQLEGYCARSLALFMEIERPEELIPIAGVDQTDEAPQEDRTIGEFYAKLLELFEELDPLLDPSRQIAGPFTWFVMTNTDHVKEAIGLIMAQGEGAKGMPYSRYPKYLSHYYRFKALSLGRELKWNAGQRCLELGKAYPPLSVLTLAPPPSTGFGLASPPEVQKLSSRFDRTFSEMVRLLENSWKRGGDATLVRAFEKMFELGAIARALMQIPTADGRGHCPTFHYIP